MEDTPQYMTPTAELVALCQEVARAGVEARALTMRADSADWTAEALAVEARVMQVALAGLTARAEKAEARVKEQQAELSEQEADKLRLVLEAARLKDAIRAATIPPLSAADAKAYTANVAAAGGAFRTGEIKGRIELARGLLNLFDL